jgi:hypothetical protein
MNEKIPVPCQHCLASGQHAGLVCSDCGGKGYRVMIKGKLAAPAMAEVRKDRRWRRRPPAPKF